MKFTLDMRQIFLFAVFVLKMLLSAPFEIPSHIFFKFKNLYKVISFRLNKSLAGVLKNVFLGLEVWRVLATGLLVVCSCSCRWCCGGLADPRWAHWAHAVLSVLLLGHQICGLHPVGVVGRWCRLPRPGADAPPLLLVCISPCVLQSFPASSGRQWFYLLW